MTFQNRAELEAVFNECINQRRTEIILDCKAVPLLDSEALELLVQMHEELRSRSSFLKIVGINEVCRDILIATRLINVFHVYGDIHDAIRRGP